MNNFIFTFNVFINFFYFNIFHSYNNQPGVFFKKRSTLSLCSKALKINNNLSCKMSLAVELFVEPLDNIYEKFLNVCISLHISQAFVAHVI